LGGRAAPQARLGAAGRGHDDDLGRADVGDGRIGRWHDRRVTDAPEGFDEPDVRPATRRARREGGSTGSAGPAGGARWLGRARRPSRAGWAVLLVVVPVALAALAGMALTWPQGVAQVAEDAGLVDPGVHFYRATVTESAAATCQGTQEDVRPDGTVPQSVACLRVQARVTEGPEAGTVVTVYPTVGVTARDVREGAGIVVEHYPATDGADEAWAFSEVERTVPLATLVLGFVLVTALVAGWRGIRAIVGLVVALVVLWVYVLPALVAGENAVLVTLCAAVAIMAVVGYLTHGFSLRTSTALLGTFVGLALVAGLGALGAWAAHLNPVTSEEDYQLAGLLGDHGLATLRGVFLAGVVLAGLGVLNDVTITQVSAVWELRAARPSAGWRSLFAGGMRIGRDHVASTIYTIAFAYVGASLPVLLLLQLYQLPLARTLTGGAFGQEVVRTLAGSIGLVLAIPLTTVVAAVVAARSDPASLRGGHAHP
jgi:uncharacterized membrane protein